MKRSGLFSCVLVASAVCSSNAVADDAVLAASTTNFGSVGPADVFYIYRIDDAAVVELHRETIDDPVQFVWSDPRTVWVYGSGKLARFVDGKRETQTAVTDADWNATTGITPVILRVTETGQVWLDTCVRGRRSPSKGVAAVCHATGYLRVDVTPLERTARAPKRLQVERATSPANGRRSFGAGISGTYRGRTLEEMHSDPKPFDGLWTISRGAKVLGDIPGKQLRLAPRR